jgi:hypothetical protein
MATKAAAKATKTQAKRRGRPGRVGNEIFEQVQNLIADQKMTRTGAFKRIAEKTGRNEGTVAANYYRVARQRGVKLQKRRRRGPSVAPVSRGPKRRGPRSAGRALTVVRELAELIRQQSNEIERLQRENQRFAEIRRLLAI